MTCDADPIALDRALDGLYFVVEGALTHENIVTCQHAAVNFVDFAIESTLIEPIGGDGNEDNEPRKPLAVRLLDLLHGLHLAVPKVVTAYHPWAGHWEQLLQSMARFCTVAPRSVRHHAVALLHSSLLQQEMDEQLSAADWHACIDNVLFPLMDALLHPPVQGAQVVSLEEIRMRTSALLSKVFLQHLAALSKLEAFPSLWMKLLTYMERFKNAGQELAEAVPESLKNMLLVMSTHGILTPDSGKAMPHSLWVLTWNRIEGFLPGMCAEVFPNVQPPERPANSATATAPSLRADGLEVSAFAPPRTSLQVEQNPFGESMSPMRAVSAPGQVGAIGLIPLMSTPGGGTVSEASSPAGGPLPMPTWPESATQPGGGAPPPPPQQGVASPNPKLQLHSTPITI